MDLSNILYEPYVIAIISALILTFIFYLFIKETNKKNKNIDEKQKPGFKKLLTIFVSSFIGFTLLIYGFRFMTSNKSGEMKGGENTISISDFSEKLNIADNDVDFGLLESNN
jgi:phosphotransferase system  glucose/maltose/N-acetylglucosamine-specific IIC component